MKPSKVKQWWDMFNRPLSRKPPRPTKTTTTITITTNRTLRTKLKLNVQGSPIKMRSNRNTVLVKMLKTILSRSNCLKIVPSSLWKMAAAASAWRPLARQERVVCAKCLGCSDERLYQPTDASSATAKDAIRLISAETRGKRLRTTCRKRANLSWSDKDYSIQMMRILKWTTDLTIGTKLGRSSVTWYKATPNWICLSWV